MDKRRRALVCALLAVALALALVLTRSPYPSEKKLTGLLRRHEALFADTVELIRAECESHGWRSLELSGTEARYRLPDASVRNPTSLPAELRDAWASLLALGFSFASAQLGANGAVGVAFRMVGRENHEDPENPYRCVSDLVWIDPDFPQPEVYTGSPVDNVLSSLTLRPPLEPVLGERWYYYTSRAGLY